MYVFNVLLLLYQRVLTFSENEIKSQNNVSVSVIGDILLRLSLVKEYNQKLVELSTGNWVSMLFCT